MNTPLIYRKIVAGVTLRQPNPAAARCALDLARALHAEVALIHAGDPPVADAEARLAALREAWPEAASAEVRRGPIWEAINDAANQLHAELIVIGAHAHGQLAALLGAPGDRVLHRATRDVMVARGECATPTPLPPYGHILIAADLNEGHGVVAERGVALAAALGVRPSLLHVVEHYPVDRENDQIPPEDADPVAWRRRLMGERLARLAEAVGCPDAVQHVAVSEDAARTEIVRYAAECGADLVVVGARRPAGLRALLGSTADGVIHHAPCDVLAVYLPD